MTSQQRTPKAIKYETVIKITKEDKGMTVTKTYVKCSYTNEVSARVLPSDKDIALVNNLIVMLFAGCFIAMLTMM